MKETYYQLIAYGTYALFENSTVKVSSQQIFKSKEIAEKYKTVFKYSCLTPKDSNDLTYFDKVDRIIIIELEYSNELEKELNNIYK